MRRIVEHIENMKERPEHVKRRFALFASGTVTALIFIVWLSVLLPRGVNQELAKKTDNGPLVPPEVAQAVGNLKEEVGEARDQWNEFSASQAAAVASWNASTTGSTSTVPTY